MKYLIVLGSVISNLGKGTVASSIGHSLVNQGYRVTAIKIDPYININADTMSPFEHGECYILRDGGVTDLDLGNYERFLSAKLTHDHNLTTGKLYQNVTKLEREGKYLGKTVQAIPHLTDYIQDYIERVAKIPVDDLGLEPEICIIELGGTTGDIEGAIFLEALDQFTKIRLDREDYCTINVSLVPTIHGNENKTKPTQQGHRILQSVGIVPDIVCLRTNGKVKITNENKIKLSKFIRVKPSHIFENPDISSIYLVPKFFEEIGMIDTVKSILRLTARKVNKVSTKVYNDILKQVMNDIDLPKITIMIVGKYTGMRDTYLSLFRALEHAAFKLKIKLDIKWIDADTHSDKIETTVGDVNGILIPGGFGVRGIESMIKFAEFARTRGIPLFGICLGMQIMLIEYTRNVVGYKDANSTEFDENTSFPIVDLRNPGETKKGDTMRLGDQTVHVIPGTLASKLHNSKKEIIERHRHRYYPTISLLDQVLDQVLDQGLVVSGKSDKFTEIIELQDKSFWMGCQYHPEFNTQHNNPNPIFTGFLIAALKFSEDPSEQKTNKQDK